MLFRKYNFKNPEFETPLHEAPPLVVKYVRSEADKVVEDIHPVSASIKYNDQSNGVAEIAGVFSICHVTPEFVVRIIVAESPATKTVCASTTCSERNRWEVGMVTLFQLSPPSIECTTSPENVKGNA